MGAGVNIDAEGLRLAACLDDLIVPELSCQVADAAVLAGLGHGTAMTMSAVS